MCCTHFISQLKKSLEDLQREKETMVVRYAQAEQRNLELSERASRSEGKLNSWAKEREIAVQKFNKMRADALKAAQLLESKVGVSLFNHQQKLAISISLFNQMSVCDKNVLSQIKG